MSVAPPLLLDGQTLAATLVRLAGPLVPRAVGRALEVPASPAIFSYAALELWLAGPPRVDLLLGAVHGEVPASRWRAAGTPLRRAASLAGRDVEGVWLELDRPLRGARPPAFMFLRLGPGARRARLPALARALGATAPLLDALRSTLSLLPGDVSVLHLAVIEHRDRAPAVRVHLGIDRARVLMALAALGWPGSSTEVRRWLGAWPPGSTGVQVELGSQGLTERVDLELYAEGPPGVDPRWDRGVARFQALVPGPRLEGALRWPASRTGEPPWPVQFLRRLQLKVTLGPAPPRAKAYLGLAMRMAGVPAIVPRHVGPAHRRRRRAGGPAARR